MNYVLTCLCRGFINREKGVLTESGRFAANTPVDPIWYHAIEIANSHGCTINVVDLAVVCNSRQDIFKLRPGFKQVASLAGGAFHHPTSEHLTLLNAFYAYIHVRAQHDRQQAGKVPPSEQVDIRNWCNEHNLNLSALEERAHERLRVAAAIKSRGDIKATSVDAKNSEIVLKVLAIAFCSRSAFYHN